MMQTLTKKESCEVRVVPKKKVSEVESVMNVIKMYSLLELDEEYFRGIHFDSKERRGTVE